MIFCLDSMVTNSQKDRFMVLRIFAPIVLTFCLVSCTTYASKPVSAFKPVPSDRVAWKSKAPAASGTLTIAREGGFYGVAASVKVDVDGKPACIIYSKECIQIPVAAGRRIVTSQGFTAIPNQAMNRPRSLEVTVSEGRETIVRIGFDDKLRLSMWLE